MINKLPSHLLHKILFKLDPRSLAKLQFVDKSLQSHISDDLVFQSKYFSQLDSTLLHCASYGSKLQPKILSTSGKSPSRIDSDRLQILSHIIGISSGLLLLFINGLCVVNPLTKKFNFIDHSSAKLFPISSYSDRDFERHRSDWETRIGFAVDKIDRNRLRFKIVSLFYRLDWNYTESIYQFEIYSENSWRISRRKLICSASELYKNTKPVYVNGCLHWLRTDGSIIVFDLESEKSRLIRVEFPEKLSSKMGFCVVENRLNLVCASNGLISIYMLMEIEMENILIPKWNLVNEIENFKIQETNLSNWSVEGFDGRIVVIREERMIYGFEINNKWKVLGSIHRSSEERNEYRDFYLFKLCWDDVVGLDEMMIMNNDDDHNDDDGDGCVSSLRKIIRVISYPMYIINNRISSVLPVGF